jgi:hypothetical protein
MVGVLKEVVVVVRVEMEGMVEDEVEVGWMMLGEMVRFEGIVARIRLEWLMGFEEVLVFCFFLRWIMVLKGGLLLLWFFRGIF